MQEKNNKAFVAFGIFIGVLGTSFTIFHASGFSVRFCLIISICIAICTVLVSYSYSLGEWIEELFGEFFWYIFTAFVAVIVFGTSYYIVKNVSLQNKEDLNLIRVNEELRLREKAMLEKKIREDEIKKQIFFDKDSRYTLRKLSHIISEAIYITKHPYSEKKKVNCSADMWDDINIRISNKEQTAFRTAKFSFERGAVVNGSSENEYQLTFTIEGINPYTNKKMRIYGKDNFFFEPKDYDSHEYKNIDMNFELYEIIK